MGVVAIIPARLNAERFPGKVLARETGRPLVMHVVESARACRSIDRVVVATDSDRVCAALGSGGSGGVECVLTSASHANGTSRLGEAADLLGLGAQDIVVNVQGDEPEIEAGAVDGAVALLTQGGFEMTTACAPIESKREHLDPNVVKVVLAQDGSAMYFSRAPIPYPRAQGVTPLRHIGLYVYRVGFLERYRDMEPTPLERCERLEQLRALGHGVRIGVHVAPRAWAGIDTPEQYSDFVKRWNTRQK